MPAEALPLFRPDVLHRRVAAAPVPPRAAEGQAVLARWADLLASPRGQKMKETELLPDFLTDLFIGILGYRPAADPGEGGLFSLRRERLVEVGGKFADAVLGAFGPGGERPVVAVEGKGPLDPLDRPFGGRALSAVDQGYGYAINLPCDWILVTNLRQIRLYHKGHTQREYERWDVAEMARDERELRRFVFVLGAERVVPGERPGHLNELLEASVKAGEAVTQQFYAEYARIRRELFRSLGEHNPERPRPQVLAATQTLLDRALFVAFAEDRGLLPENTLADAYRTRNPYNPQPVWDNFRGLFRAIDLGSADLGIPRYNGGLFAPDPVVDALSVPDAACEHFRRLGAYDYRAPEDVVPGDDQGQLVDVELLGHIFEQSITDLEQLQAAADEEAAGTAVPRRRREGAFYTPSFITRFIVGDALKPVLEGRFAAVRAAERHRAVARKTSRTALALLDEPAVYDLDRLTDVQRRTLVAFWEAWLAELQTVRVVDPACGSGAFLIEAFDQLFTEYQRAVDHLTALERQQVRVFDPDRAILQNNLYGVDLNAEAIEIARLSIWIKTAQRGKVLTDLDHNVRPGNSVVHDPAVDERAFDWRAVFPEVFAQGGFDVVIGNPPYVRAELLSEPVKRHLQARFRTWHGTADLYTYFYELGMELLRPGGRLSYIVTNKWLKSGYGEPLREFFAREALLERIIDFGHAPIFPDADVFPVILVAAKPEAGRVPDPNAATEVAIFPREELGKVNIPEFLRSHAYSVPSSRFGGGPWSLEPPGVEALMQKIREGGVPLREYVGASPLYGLKTGFNDAFLIDSRTREELIAREPEAAPIIRPYLRGQDVRRWSPEWDNLWMIVMKSSENHDWPWAKMEGDAAERQFADTFPVLHGHFGKYRERLSNRSDQGRHWWELRSCAYYYVFDRPKIVYQEIQFHPSYCRDRTGFFSNNKAFLLPSEDTLLLAVLNSPLIWWHNWRYLPHMKDEALSPAGFRMEQLPIAKASDQSRAAVEPTVARLISLASHRQNTTVELLDWLRMEFGIEKPSQKLQAPQMLSGDEWIAEIKKLRGRSGLSAAELARLRGEYEQSVRPLIADRRTADALEREISDAVNAAYGLTPEDVDLMWRTAPPRMPAAARP